jgi:hypothetical protein
MNLRIALLIIFFIAIFVSTSSGSNANAQSGYQEDSWTDRERIPGIHDLANTPSMVVDGEGTVHAFHAQPVPADGSVWAIVYSKWNPDQGWSDPNDIILPMNGQIIRVPSAFLDENGMMHLVFYCCDDFNPNIYYAKAWAKNAGNAQAWSEPQLIGRDAKAPASAVLVGDGIDKLIALFSGVATRTGVYAVSSHDGGTSWSEPFQVFRTFDESLIPFDPKLEPDKEGRVHAVWGVNRIDGNGDAIYYARLEADYLTWSDPTLLASAEGEQVPAVSSPAIVSHDALVIVVYLEWAPPKRLIRVSTDGGQTWSERSEFLPPTRGEYGPADFAVDSNNTLHVIMGDRARGLNLWHSIMQEGIWQAPEPVAPLFEAQAYPVGHPLEFHPIWPRIAISRGNIMLLSWALDPGHGDNGTWFSYKTLDAPESPSNPLPLPQVTPASTIVPTKDLPSEEATALPSPSPLPADYSEDVQSELDSNSLMEPLIAGLFPVIFLAMAVFIVRQLTQDRGL